MQENIIVFPEPSPDDKAQRVRHTLPVSLSSLIGREQEVQAIQAVLLRSDVRLLTLTGTAGVGKTRLALEVARRLVSDFVDGVYLVPLAPLSDPDLVIPTIAHRLGLVESGSQPILELLKLSQRDKHRLLILDNFEQVIEASPLLLELLEACRDVKILVTSREVLRLRGEQQFVVPPLALPDPRHLPDARSLPHVPAVNLFLQRAQAIQPDFDVTTDHAEAIAQICHRLDGLPLAIELAAARVKLLPPQALLARLSQRLALLTSGARDAPDRQQTLRKTIDWSYSLLEEDEKRLFRRLAAFVGGCTLEAVEALCHAPGDLEEDVLDGVARLVDKSLLQQRPEVDGEPRLLMLETIREYALERLQASGEAEAMRRQHATFFLQLAEEAEPKFRSAEQATWRRRLEIEQDNLRAALRWTLESQEAEMGLQLAGALLAFWRANNQDREGRSWCEQVLAPPGAQAHTAARAKALLAAGTTTLFQGDPPEAHRLLEESIAIGREIGAVFKRNLAHALAMLANVTLLQGNLRTSRELAAESVRLFREMGEAWGTAIALVILGNATVELGDPGTARSFLEESAALFRKIGDKQRLALPLNALGLVALYEGNASVARAHCEEALAVAQGTGDVQLSADALTHLGTVSQRVGDYQQAAALYQQSLALISTRGHRVKIAEDLAGLAEVANLAGQIERAAQLFGAVEVMHEATCIRLSPLRRAEYERTVEDIRTHLDEAAFAAAWKKGRTMTLEQVIAYALETKDALPTAASPPEVDTGEVPSSGALSSAPSPQLSPRRAMKQHFGGLTAREREVASLVAQGKSNRVIAGELVVGISTVEAHITHIFTKLGFSSRAQIAAWAVEKGLVQVQQDVEVKRQGHELHPRTR